MAAVLAVTLHAWALDPTALPTGGQIVAGQGSINTSGSTMTVTQGSERMVSNWATFNIGRNASVSFQQPNTSSVALNRILDTFPSQIFGQLSANGQVFLLNPSGILFGSTACVDVGGLVTSSLNMTNENFMAGHYTFEGSGADGFVLNQGDIRTADGGYVAFIAPHVENQGQITTPQGTTAMVAAGKVRLDFSGDQLVNFIVDEGAVDTLVANSGAIRADGGTVLLTAAGAERLTSAVVNNSGVIEAKSMINQEGRIVLTAEAAGGDVRISGTLDVSGTEAGTTGGTVIATGGKVTLDAGATVDACGSTGGGEVYIGGGWQGNDTSIHNATETVVKQGTILEASAIDNGNGGTVVVWSDKDTYFSGSIFATGGEYSGDGGNVEVSGKENLGFFGNVNVLSPNGMNGSLLLDPNDLTILNGASGQTGTYADWSNHDDYGSYSIPETVLESLTGNVILTAMSNITIQDLADNVLNLSADSISFFSNDESTPSSAGGFTMDASDTIRLNGTGDLTLQGGSQAGPSYAYSIYAGNLETNGGNVIFNTKRSSAALPIRVLGTITTNGGNVSVAAGTRFGLTNSVNVDVQLDGLVSTSGGNFTSNMEGTVKIDGGMNLGAGSASFGGTGTQINSVITSTANVTIASPLTFGAGSGITTTGTVTFNQTASMDSAGADVTLTASNFVFNNTFTGNNGTITLKPYSASTNVDIGTAGTGDMTISNTNFSKLSGFANVTVGRADGTGVTNVVSDTSVSTSGYLELANQIVNVNGGTLTNTGGDIILTGDTFSVSKSITANSGNGKVTMRQLTAGNPITLGTDITTGILSQLSAGTIEIGRIDG
ncbi:MAG: filamentous hemagglutinin N-terminal domain-containing protein, partial [Proteobacteria bacterium]|nr:filamentous hemagglutinin N-terminal domain-containing protein [Pseudomonadota bacterium]